MDVKPVTRFTVIANIRGMHADWHAEITRAGPREKLSLILEAVQPHNKRVTVVIGKDTEEDKQKLKTLMESDCPLTYYATPCNGFKRATFDFVLLP